MTDSYHVILSKRAERNLEGIFAYIEKDSPSGAADMVRRILDAVATLEIFPHRTRVGVEKKDLKHPLRSLPVWPYVIFFRVFDERRVVRIIHIRHGARLPPQRFD